MELIIGNIYSSNNCGDFLLKNIYKVEGENFYRCSIKILKTGYESSVRKADVKRGSVRDPYYPLVFGIGYIGEGKYSQTLTRKVYNCWNGMLDRCYNTKFSKSKKNYKDNNITVCKNWHCFQNFGIWYEEHYKENFSLDKDIIYNVQHMTNKIYSPETCIMIPKELNEFLADDCVDRNVRLTKNKRFSSQIQSYCLNNKQIYLGTYDTFKEAKNAYAKEKYKIWISLVEKYRNILDDEIYNILLKYDFSWYWKLE